MYHFCGMRKLFAVVLETLSISHIHWELLSSPDVLGFTGGQFCIKFKENF